MFASLFHKKRPEMTPYMKEVLTAAEEGNAEAQFCLAMHYGNGSNGFEKNEAQCMKWMHKAADQGWLNALYVLGLQYMAGINCQENTEQALGYFQAYLRQAHPDEARYPNAAFYAGSILVSGNASQEDINAGAYWLCKAAHMGVPDAQSKLAMVYITQDSGLYDPGQAFIWFQRAAQSGLAEAQRGMGMCYLLGEGVGRNVAEAANWFRLAAQQGDEKALLALQKYCGG